VLISDHTPLVHCAEYKHYSCNTTIVAKGQAYTLRDQSKKRRSHLWCQSNILWI